MPAGSAWFADLPHWFRSAPWGPPGRREFLVQCESCGSAPRSKSAKIVSRQHIARERRSLSGYHFGPDHLRRGEILCQSFGVALATQWEISVAPYPAKYVVVGLAVAAEVIHLVFSHWDREDAQDHRRQDPLDAARRHRVQHRVIRIVQGYQRPLGRHRARLEHVGVLLQFLPAQVVPVHLLVEVAVELGRLADVVVEVRLVAVELNEQVVEDLLVAERRHRLPRLHR